jgi:hypothetical protein
MKEMIYLCVVMLVLGAWAWCWVLWVENERQKLRLEWLILIPSILAFYTREAASRRGMVVYGRSGSVGGAWQRAGAAVTGFVPKSSEHTYVL